MRLTQEVIDKIQLAMTHTKMNGETAGEEPAATFEKERKARAKYFKEHFEMVTLDGGSWQIEVPRRIKE